MFETSSGIGKKSWFGDESSLKCTLSHGWTDSLGMAIDTGMTPNGKFSIDSIEWRWQLTLAVRLRIRYSTLDPLPD